MSGKIAFFDFDGTITHRDTLLAFIKFTRGAAAFVWGFALHLPYIVAYKLGIISNQAAKEKVLKYFFGGMPEGVFHKYCQQFATAILPSLLRSKAVVEIKNLQQAGFEVVIVSASPQAWIKPWADGLGLKLIASDLEAAEGKLTGKLRGRNCHGIEKVARIKQQFSLNHYSEIFAYGDTKGDLPMLALAGHKFYKPFRE